MRWLLSASLLLLVITAPAQAMQEHQIAESEARQHLIDHPDPVYPAIAKAAQVQGNVVVRITIDTAGKVVSEKPISGPPMLLEAAVDAIKSWTFKPFQIDGSAERVKSEITVNFTLYPNGDGPSEEQQKSEQATFPLLDKCQAALKARDVTGALAVCKQAVDLSLKAGDSTQSDQLMMIECYESYGRALLAADQPKNALAAEDRAIELAKIRLKDADQEYAMPFFWRAVVEMRLGEFTGASDDFATAEATHRKAIEQLPSMAKMYGTYLASILNIHAQLLEGMGKTREANALRVEAASLRQTRN
ncbi:MAG TPA: energy transducer TonB [Acidobacteriaceae bacterium]|nr:energy transducer TonB [Acidobacteriaceae bacterium]